MPFQYRLEKILKYRIQKRDEQQEVVAKAAAEVQRIQAEIDKNLNSVAILRKSIYNAHHTMMENYDTYIKHLDEIIEKLEEEKQIAINKLNEEREKLEELEKAVKVVEKHKEKALEQYKAEERQLEMKRLDEVAGQKYFAKTLAKTIEEEEEKDY